MKTKLVLAAVAVVVFAGVGFVVLQMLSENAQRIMDSSYDLCATRSPSGTDCSGYAVAYEAGATTRMLVSALAGAVAALVVTGALALGLRRKIRSGPDAAEV
jgi:hypothetical protein